MKKKSVISFLLAAVMAFSMLLSGCFDSNAAKKSADVFCSLVFKSESENLDKFGITESKKDELLDMYHDQIKKQLKNNVTMWGGYISETQLNDITDAYLETLSKVTFETKQISKSGDSAEVEISTTHFDVRKTDEQAMMAALDEIENMKFSSDYEELSKLMEVYLTNIPDKIRNAEISSDKSTNTYKFKKVDKNWMPEDEENFGYMLAMQATNNDNLNLSIDETRITPEESAEIFWKLSAKADTSGFEKLGYSKEFGDKLISYVNKKLVKQMQDEFTGTGAELSDEEVQKMITALMNGLGKNDAQFEEVSKDGDTAKVKVTSTVIDINSIIETVVNKTANDAIAAGTTDVHQIMQAYCTNFINEMNNVQPISKSSNYRTFEFTKVADMWFPSNVDEFSEDISTMCIQ